MESEKRKGLWSWIGPGCIATLTLDSVLKQPSLMDGVPGGTTSFRPCPETPSRFFQASFQAAAA